MLLSNFRMAPLLLYLKSGRCSFFKRPGQYFVLTRRQRFHLIRTGILVQVQPSPAPQLFRLESDALSFRLESDALQYPSVCRTLHVAVVGSAEYRYHRREASRVVCFVHLVPSRGCE